MWPDAANTLNTNMSNLSFSKHKKDILNMVLNVFNSNAWLNNPNMQFS